jgi:hypothetical protein
MVHLQEDGCLDKVHYYWFVLYNYITVHGAQNIKIGIYFCNPQVIEIQRYHLLLHTYLKSQQMIR